MSNFDFKAACKEVAVPAFNNLSDEIKGIYTDICKDYSHLKQGRDLDIKIPEELRVRFDKLTTEALAMASCIIHSFGHWAFAEAKTVDQYLWFGRWHTKENLPGAYRSSDVPLSGLKKEVTEISSIRYGASDRSGAHWKFSNMVDQILIERLEIDKRSSDKRGFCIMIHEGMLRVGASGRDFWTWKEVGIADEQTLINVKAIPKPQYCNYSSAETYINDCKKSVADLGGKFNETWLDIAERFQEQS